MQCIKHWTHISDQYVCSLQQVVMQAWPCPFFRWGSGLKEVTWFSQHLPATDCSESPCGFTTSETQVSPVSLMQMWEPLQTEKKVEGRRERGPLNNLLWSTRGLEIHIKNGGYFEMSISACAHSFSPDILSLHHLCYDFRSVCLVFLLLLLKIRNNNNNKGECFFSMRNCVKGRYTFSYPIFPRK